jgi:hypothetical protein
MWLLKVKGGELKVGSYEFCDLFCSEGGKEVNL